MAQEQGAPISMKNESLMLCLENLIMIMASNKSAFFNSEKDISALESKFVNLLSTLTSYVKSKSQGRYI